MSETTKITLPAVVEKVIKLPIKGEPEKVQIAIKDADPLYREIRIPNKLTDEDGTEHRLKPGAEVEVTVEADAAATVKDRV